MLAKNSLQAERNRGWLEGRNILALNLVSSPGAGKTALLERTIQDVGGELAISVVEGDQETLYDAERIRATGCRAVQLTTGTRSQLDREMLGHAARQLTPPAGSTLMIENVGNLVCPALFDLGERAKVVILSMTEGEDKPAKYPKMFREARVAVLTKLDLLPYVPFDVDRAVAEARRVNSGLEFIFTSALADDGLAEWFAFIRRTAAAVRV